MKHGEPFLAWRPHTPATAPSAYRPPTGHSASTALTDQGTYAAVPVRQGRERDRKIARGRVSLRRGLCFQLSQAAQPPWCRHSPGNRYANRQHVHGVWADAVPALQDALMLPVGVVVSDGTLRAIVVNDGTTRRPTPRSLCRPVNGVSRETSLSRPSRKAGLRTRVDRGRTIRKRGVHRRLWRRTPRIGA